MIATYRLQLHPGFTFADAERVLPYLQRLGVSHLYLSPINEARKGSTHGYDVIDHNVIREDLGGRAGFDRLLAAARAAGMGLVIDFVPNHAGVGPRNVYWQDVLAYGAASPYACYFDIDWKPLKPELQNKILLPFLGSTYGEALDRGEITIQYQDGRFFAEYFDARFALAPASYAAIIESALPRFERSDDYWILKDVLEAYRRIEPGDRERAETLRPRLLNLTGRLDAAGFGAHLSTASLHAILEQQHWRLAYWKTAGYEINYRRFFDINGLVGLHMEDDRVFWDSHRLLAELLTLDGVTGVRIDHVDGLFDPHRYLGMLRQLGAASVWVEKILASGEVLPAEWPVEGTSGYEYLNDVLHVLVCPDGEHLLDRVYKRLVPEAEPYDDVVYESKKMVMATTLSSELFRLTYELDRISEADYRTRDFTLEALRAALEAVVACFDRYRTYLPHNADEAREVVQMAVRKAQQRNPATEPSVYEFVARIILGDVREDLRKQQQSWAGRFQQYTAPVAAKGVEDTAFYRYYRLAAMNEVGGEADAFGQTVQSFHSHNRFRAYRYPRNLLATATHDHKRGEDTRMRMLALAEAPDLWERTLGGLGEIAEEAMRDFHQPTRADRYVFFQALTALWQGADQATLADRLVEYMLKASRESKIATSWLNQDEHYEEALEHFVRAFLADERLPEAIADMASLAGSVGFHNTISQVVLKFTSPGVPDIYQGCELLDLSLVDPDNRRPVDFERRAAALEEASGLLETPGAEPLQALLDACNPQAKLYLTARLLALKRAHACLREGAYRPLSVSGPGAAHWIAFSRESEGEAAVVVVSRFPTSLPHSGEAGVELPEALAGQGRFADALTGAVVEAAGGAVDARALPVPWAVLLPAG